MKSINSCFRVFSSIFSTLIITACGLNLPPEDSISRGTYDSCMANADAMEKAGGSKIYKIVRQKREYCKCSSEVLWEAEQELGWSMVEDRKTGEKLFNKCASNEEKEKKQQEIAEQKRKEEEKQKFIDSIDSLFR